MKIPIAKPGAKARRGESATLGEALFRMLEEGEAVGRKRGRKKGRKPSLESVTASRFAEAAAVIAASAAGVQTSLWIDGDAPALVFVSATDSAEVRGAFSGLAAALASLAMPGAPCGIIGTERVTAASLGLLRARIGGGRSYTAREGHVFVHADESLASAVETALGTAKGAVEKLVPGDPALMAAPASISIDRGQDLVLSHFFLPPFFPLAAPAPAGAAAPPHQEAAVFWDTVSSGRPGAPGSAWFAGSYGEPQAGLQAAFECPAPAGPGHDEFIARILPILREGWNKACARMAKFAPAGSAARFGKIAQAPESLLKGAVRVSGEIRVGSGGFGVSAHLPPRFVAALAHAMRPLPESPGARGPLAEFMAANEALLERWQPNVRELFLKPRVPPGAGRPTGSSPLAPLLAAMGGRDAAVSVQNCLLPNYGARGLPYLFFYHAPFVRNGKHAMRPVPLAPFRDGDIMKLLPGNAREEWAHERKMDLPQRTIPAGTCVSVNDEATKFLWESANSGKLELSPASFDLLRERVGKRLEAEARARLSALADRDIPFGYLASLDRRDAMRLIDRLPNRDLAMASVGDVKHVDLLHASMSSGRKRDFDEELAFAEKRLERGELGPEPVVAMKTELLERMKECVEDIKRERATELDARVPEPRPEARQSTRAIPATGPAAGKREPPRPVRKDSVAASKASAPPPKRKP